jgi:CDGSH-type Zn-finger protein
MEEKRDPKVVCIVNGPYLVYGQNVVDVDGSIHFHDSDNNKPIALCACARSCNKPLCDGSHKSGASGT